MPRRSFVLATWLALATPAGAGCGADNPNCIVPTAPNGDSSNRAASTAFVQGLLTGGASPQLANSVFAGPSTGVPAGPTFRSLVGADLPAPQASALGGVKSASAPVNRFGTGIDAAGNPTFAQPSCANLSGVAASCSTDATNASNIGSGTLAYGRLPSFASTGTLNAGNPAGTGSTTAVMMGLGTTCKITPTASGKVLILFNFTHASAGVTTDVVRPRFGTGAPPAYNTGVSGTALGNDRAMYEPTATASLPVSLAYQVNGTPIGTQLWADLALASGSNGTVATISGIDCSLQEVP